MEFKTFFKSLVEQFHLQGASYAVMRNAEYLPDSTNGSDIDFLFDKDDRSLILEIFSQIAFVSDCRIIGFDNANDFCKFSIACMNDHSVWAVCVDCNFGLNFKGIPYFTAEFKDISVFENGFFKLSREWEVIFSILKEVLHNGFIDEKIKMQAKEIHLNKIEKEIKEKFKDQPLLVRLLQDLDISITESINRAFNKSHLLRNPVWYVFCKLRYINHRFLRVINPCGYVISFHGIDGVGKSTVLSTLHPIFNVANHKNTEVIHLRPRLLPALAEIKNKLSKTNDCLINPTQIVPMYSKPNSGYLLSYVRLMYLLMDYFFGYMVKYVIKLRKNNTVLLFDRYYDDVIVDPSRFRICLDQKKLRLFKYFIPKCNSKILLTIDPNIAWQRKRELSPEIAVSLQQRFIAEFSEFNDIFTLDTTKLSEKEVSSRVLRYLTNSMDLHHRKRLKAVITND